MWKYSMIHPKYLRDVISYGWCLAKCCVNDNDRCGINRWRCIIPMHDLHYYFKINWCGQCLHDWECPDCDAPDIEFNNMIDSLSNPGTTSNDIYSHHTMKVNDIIRSSPLRHRYIYT